MVSVHGFAEATLHAVGIHLQVLHPGQGSLRLNDIQQWNIDQIKLMY